MKCAGVYRHTRCRSVCFIKMGLSECCTLISKLLFTFHNTLWRSPEAMGRGLIKLCRFQILHSWLCHHLPFPFCSSVPFQCHLSPFWNRTCPHIPGDSAFSPSLALMVDSQPIHSSVCGISGELRVETRGGALSCNRGLWKGFRKCLVLGTLSWLGS